MDISENYISVRSPGINISALILTITERRPQKSLYTETKLEKFMIIKKNVNTSRIN